MILRATTIVIYFARLSTLYATQLMQNSDIVSWTTIAEAEQPIPSDSVLVEHANSSVPSIKLVNYMFQVILSSKHITALHWNALFLLSNGAASI